MCDCTTGLYLCPRSGGDQLVVALPLVALDGLRLVDRVEGDRANGAELAHDGLGQTGGLIGSGRLPLHDAEVAVPQTLVAYGVGQAVGAAGLERGVGQCAVQVDVNVRLLDFQRVARALLGRLVAAGLVVHVVHRTFALDQADGRVATFLQRDQPAVRLGQLVERVLLSGADVADLLGHHRLVGCVDRVTDRVACRCEERQNGGCSGGQNPTIHGDAPDYTRVECRGVPDTLLLTILDLRYFSSVFK